MESFAFAQCAAVLFDSPPRLEEVERALEGWRVAGRPTEGPGDHGWALCGPGVVIELRSGALAVVDVVERPWPDDARAAETVPSLGSAWSVGAFGPRASPGALARALDQPWSWSGGAAAAAQHRGFVRLRTGGAAAGADDEDGIAAGDPAYDLLTLTELARALLRLPGALAFFVPGGEALRSAQQVEAALERKAGAAAPPFDLWINVRAVALASDAEARWLALDTVGMNQLALADQEAVFAEGKEEPRAVEALLLNACRHLALARPLPAGAVADDGAGRRWKASAVKGLLAPTRAVLRWLPEESTRPSAATLARLAPTAGTGSG
jgi:hypothetical protein